MNNDFLQKLLQQGFTKTNPIVNSKVEKFVIENRATIKNFLHLYYSIFKKTDF
jgi:hypothetical protein